MEEIALQNRPLISADSQGLFVTALASAGGVYIVLIVAMLTALASFTTPGHLMEALASPEIRFSTGLSLISSTITMILSIWVAVPLGYLLSRYTFPLKVVVDAIVDIPIVLPPLVIGLSLLILFQTRVGRAVECVLPFTYAKPGIILAQFSVACAFAVRTMRVTFDQITPRAEHVAMTLGCSRAEAFWVIAIPEARRGILTAATLAWARALGEFGPILVFSGATRFRTEVLPTSVFLELSIGNLEAAIAVSLLMVIAAVMVLLIVRLIGGRSTIERAMRP